jgi:hypothetical protein
MTTPKASGRECITHHHACDCREAEFAAVTAERDALLARAEAAEEKLEKVRDWEARVVGVLPDMRKELHAILAPGGGEKGET